MADGTVDIDVRVESAGAEAKMAALEAAGEKLGGIGGKMATAAKVGMAALGGAFAAMGKAALDSYARYEQLVGGVDTLFKGSSKTVQAYAANAYRDAGMSANQYMTQVTSFAASLTSSLGGDTAKAAEYGNMAVVDMADNVNKMGSSMTSVQDAYNGFAKQNYTMLDNLKLGYGGTQSEMQRLISDANAVKSANGEMADLSIDSFADVVEAIHIVQSEMGITGTTAKESASTIEGSVSTMRAAWENWLTGLGSEDADMAGLTEKLIASVEQVAVNVAPRLATIFGTIATELPKALAGIGEVLYPILCDAVAGAWNGAVQALAGAGIELPEIDSSTVDDALTTLGELVDFCMGQLPAIIPVVAGVAGAFAAFNAISTISGIVAVVAPALGTIGSVIGMAIGSIAAGAPVIGTLGAALGLLMSPATIAAVAIGAVIAIVVALATNVGGCRDMAIAAFNGLVQFIAGLPAAIGGFLTMVITNVLSWAGQMASNAVRAGSQFLSNVVSFLSQLPGRVWSFLTSVISKAASWVSQMASKAVSAGSQFISNVASFLSQLPGRVWSFLSSAISKAVSFASQFASKAVSAARDFASNLVNGLTSLPGRVVSIGSDIIGGIVNGISGAAGSVVDAVTDAVGGAIEAAKQFLGIASPSKVFRDEVGRWIPLGAAVGIEEEAGAVQTALGRALDLDADVRVARSVSIGAAAQQPARIEQTVNFYQRAESPDELARTMRMYSAYGLAGVR